MAEMARPVDDEALDLMEHRRMRLVAVAAIGAARTDHADRRLLLQHGADLDRRGVGTQHLALALGVRLEEEGVVHVPRRMAWREVERREVQPIRLDIGTLRDREPHIGEDRREFVHDLADRMHATPRSRALAQRKSKVEPLGREPHLERRIGERTLALIQRGLSSVAQVVDERTFLAPLLGGHGTERLQQLRNRALLAERLDAHRLQRRLIGSSADRGQEIAFERGEVGHVELPSADLHPRICGRRSKIAPNAAQR